jgi:predicted nucleotide-binding protein
MGRKQFSAPEPDYTTMVTRLMRSREDATKLLEARISDGEQLIARPVRSETELDQLRQDAQIWSDYNTEFLAQIFDTPRYSKEYSELVMGTTVIGASPTQRAEYRKRDIREYLSRLRSIMERLPLIDIRMEVRDSKATAVTPNLSRKVFVVHGRDDAARLSVAQFLQKLGLSPVVLHEQPNAGRTILEKFEGESDVAFAVVLLTPDDQGALAGAPNSTKPRARQNVILELGYFLGRLGRRNVCCLYDQSVEVPSDIFGLAYVPYDSAGAWQVTLARELDAAGIEIDLNRILR